MSEAVKRYCMRAFGSIVQPIEVPYSGTWVPSADHDRIVSCMTAGREAVERENKWLRAQVRELERTALALRAEVERLRKDAERINWLSAQARMIYGRKDEASYQLSELPELIQSSREECQPDDLRRAIDAAMEASR